MPISPQSGKHDDPQKSPLFSRITTADFLQIGLMVFSLVSFAIHMQDRQDQETREIADMRAQITQANQERENSYTQLLRTLQEYHQQTLAFQQNLTIQLQGLQILPGSKTGRYSK